MSDVIANVTIPVSLKYAVNIGKWIKGRNVDKAIMLLEKVIKKEVALPVKTFKRDTPHKKGIAAGRYPVKTAEYVIKALNLVKANARNKSLDDSKLVISEFIPNLAYSIRSRARYRRGRLIHLKVGAVVKND